MAKLAADDAFALLKLERDEAEQRKEDRIRVALEQATQERAWATKPISKASKALFIQGLAAGVPITVISEKLEIGRIAFYRLRRADSEFAQAWDDALEIRAEPIIDRLADIAESGAADAMATVRAAEVLLRGTVKRFNQAPASTQVSAKMTKHSDGSASFETRLGAFSD